VLVVYDAPTAQQMQTHTTQNIKGDEERRRIQQSYDALSSTMAQHAQQMQTHAIPTQGDDERRWVHMSSDELD